MAASEEVDPTVLSKFAQKLAANEKKTRDFALKKLRKWMTNRSNGSLGYFTEKDMLMIWKGLHYCMWMSDKPLVQEELADRLSDLIQCFESDKKSAFRFIDAFFKTEGREWFKIDKLRLDKFMMLIRKFLNKSLVFIQSNGWKKKQIERFGEILSGHMISATNDDVPLGIKLHIMDIYMDELEKVATGEINSEKTLMFLEPYCLFMCKPQSSATLKHLMKCVFFRVIDYAVEKVEREERRQEMEDEDEEEEGPLGLEIDYGVLADRLFELASGKDCAVKNRKQIYNLVKTYRDLSAGMLPMEDQVSSGEDEPAFNVKLAVDRLQHFEAVTKTRKRKKKNKKSKSHNDSEQQSSGQSDDDEEEQSRPAKKAKLVEHKKSKKEQKIKQCSSEDDIQAPNMKKKKKKKSQESTIKHDKQSVIGSPGAGIQDDNNNNSITTSNKKKKKHKDKGLPEALCNGTGDASETLSFVDDDEPEKIVADIVVPSRRVKLKDLVNAPLTKPTLKVVTDDSLGGGGDAAMSGLKMKSKPLVKDDALDQVLFSGGFEDNSDDDRMQIEQEIQKLQKEKAEKPELVAGKAKKESKKKRRSLPANLSNQDSISNLPESRGIEIPGTGEFIIPASSNVSDSISEKLNKKKRRKSTGSSVDSVAPVSDVNTIVEKKNKKNKIKNSGDGEYEIVIPKRKKSLENGIISNVGDDDSASSGNSKKDNKAKNKQIKAFATFENLKKTPPAFVRKAVSKSASPKRRSTEKLKQTKAATLNNKSRRVSFAMEMNKSQDFRDSLVPSPVVAFDPQITPNQGILKTAASNTPKESKSLKMNLEKDIFSKKRARAEDFF